MKLSGYFSGGKPQRGEEGIGGGVLGLPLDPVLNLGQPFGRLMDVVAIDDIGEGFEQLFEALAPVHDGRGGGHADPASRRVPGRSQFLDLSHPSAFPRGIPAATQNLPAAG